MPWVFKETHDVCFSGPKHCKWGQTDRQTDGEAITMHQLVNAGNTKTKGLNDLLKVAQIIWSPSGGVTKSVVSKLFYLPFLVVSLEKQIPTVHLPPSINQQRTSIFPLLLSWLRANDSLQFGQSKIYQFMQFLGRMSTTKQRQRRPLEN